MHTSGILYVVGTPIGNLDDFPPRARQVLGQVDVVLAEDTRHSRKLLDHFGIVAQMQSLHEHNERSLAPTLLDAIAAGQSMALISDAGMPLISDPGYTLLRLARERAVPVRVIPGPSAVLAALAVSGLPSDRFIFEGFLPSKASARRSHLGSLCDEARTLILFESPKRIVASLADLVQVFGGERPASLSRELTKLYEQTLHGSLHDLHQQLLTQPDICRGEMVLVVGGNPAAPAAASEISLAQILQPLLDTLPLSQAVALAVRISGAPRKGVYAQALEMAGKHGSTGG